MTIAHSLIRNGDSHSVYLAYNNPQTSTHDTNFINNASNATQPNQPKSDILLSGLNASGNSVNCETSSPI
jgi:hypothetical protein